MKAPFVSVTLLLIAGGPAALGAEIAGMLLSGVQSFPALIGFPTASGVLAIACWDYTRKPSGDAPGVRNAAPRPAEAAPSAPAAAAAWVHHTQSA